MFRLRQLESDVVALVAAAWLCAHAGLLRAEAFADAFIGAAYNSNLTRAQAPDDHRSDRWIEVALSIGRYLAFDGYRGATVAVDLRADRHDRFRGLDVLAIGASASYRRKFALGLDAPYAVVAATIAREDFEADVRDSNRYELRAELGRRLDERIDVAAGVAYDRRDADTNLPIVPGFSGAIFDLRGVSGYARAELAIASAWAAGLRTGVRRGDVESTSQRGPQVFRASDAIADDPAFRDPALFGYRLRGTTWSVAANLSFAIDDRSTIDVAWLHDDTHAAEGLRYRSRGVNAAFIHRF